MCKIPLKIRMIINGVTGECRAYFHPRGCMGARINHLDIEPNCIPVLEDLGFKHGLGVKCSQHRECIMLDIDPLNISLELCPVRGLLMCRDRVYVMITHSGFVYVGDVLYRRG